MTIAEDKIRQVAPENSPQDKRKRVLIAALLGGLAGALVVRLTSQSRPSTNWPFVACILGWVLFSIYWSVSATSAPAKAAESRGSRRIHEFLMNAGYLLLLLPAALPPTIPVVQDRWLPAWPALTALGLAVQAGSFALAVWARQTLGRNWSGRIEIKMDHQLIRSGPYRVLRHPIYTAVLGMAAGTALAIGKLHALFAITVIVYAYIRKTRMEEAKLYEAFGTEYDEYRRGTWGLIPGLF